MATGYIKNGAHGICHQLGILAPRMTLRGAKSTDNGHKDGYTTGAGFSQVAKSEMSGVPLRYLIQRNVILHRQYDSINRDVKYHFLYIPFRKRSYRLQPHSFSTPRGKMPRLIYQVQSTPFGVLHVERKDLKTKSAIYR
jgi:hypothetical protein